MGINRVDGVSNAGDMPDPKRVTTGKQPTGSSTFGEIFATIVERDIHATLTADLRANDVVNHLTGYNDAQLAMAMSIIASWEVGRREAIRAAMEARQHEAGMRKLLDAFAAKVTTVQPSAKPPPRPWKATCPWTAPHSKSPCACASVRKAANRRKRRRTSRRCLPSPAR